MVETPEDIKAAARAVLQFDVMETVEIKGVPILLLNIERAILAERLSRATTPTASELVEEYYSDDPAKLKRLLAQRDKFIVDQGLWSLFVGALSNVGEE